MSKIELDTDVTNINNALLAYNENFRKLEVELQDKVLYRDNPTGEPNQLENDIDMNGNRVYNLPLPTSPSEAANKQYIDNYAQYRLDELFDLLQIFVDQSEAFKNQAEGFAIASENSSIASQNSALGSSNSASDSFLSAEQSENWAELSLEYSNNAQNSAVSSQFSANASADSASQAAIYSSLGLGGAVGFDFGSIADTVIIFPTDFGSIV